MKYFHKKQRQIAPKDNQLDTATNSINSLSECKVCNKTYGNKFSLKVHMETVHDNTKKFLCHICNKCFTQAVSLTRHIHSVHEKLKPYKCDICQRAFGYKHSLNYHKNRVH